LKKSFDSKKDLWNYLIEENNSYLQKKKINGYDFSLLYKPTDLLVEQELGTFNESNLTLRKEKIKILREKFQPYMYFILSISRDNKELLSTTPKNQQEFGVMLNQLAFGMREKVTLFTSKKDTIKMIDYNYQRMYGMSKSTTMLFIYPKDEKYFKSQYLNFTIQDLGTLTGEVKLKIETIKIKNQPILNL
tara:strand:+ start:39628 stop:40197 length:570 start_codon:yes stop_codon:yes gene_type:complete